MKECCKKKVKEVFDDVNNLLNYYSEKPILKKTFLSERWKIDLDSIKTNILEQLKKRHLSTFPKEKQDNSRKTQSAVCDFCYCPTNVQNKNLCEMCRGKLAD